MKNTHHTTEQIRETVTRGQSHEELCRQHNISSQTFYRWKQWHDSWGPIR